MEIETATRVWHYFSEADPVWGPIFGFLSVMISGGFVYMTKRQDRRTNQDQLHEGRRKTDHKVEQALRDDLLEYARTLHEDFNSMREEIWRVNERAKEAEQRLKETKWELRKAYKRIEHLEATSCNGRCSTDG